MDTAFLSTHFWHSLNIEEVSVLLLRNKSDHLRFIIKYIAYPQICPLLLATIVFASAMISLHPWDLVML